MSCEDEKCQACQFDKDCNSMAVRPDTAKLNADMVKLMEPLSNGACLTVLINLMAHLVATMDPVEAKQTLGLSGGRAYRVYLDIRGEMDSPRDHSKLN